jgi:hypothetical protein
MSSASGPLSPITQAAAKDAEPLSSKEFAARIKYLERAAKSLVKITALVNKHDMNQPLRIRESVVIKRSDVPKYLDAFLYQLRDLRKIYNNRKKRSSGKSNQLHSLFKISDQLRNFYKKANLGPIDLEKPRGKKLATMVKLVTEKGMATSGILTSLLSRYIEVNGLKSETTGGRFIPDSHMMESFATTHFLMDSEKLGKRKVNTQNVSAERIEKVRLDISEGKLSAFDRFQGRVDKKSGEPVYDKERGVAYTGTMVINNRYRIPACLLTEEEREELADTENLEESRELQRLLTSITEQNKKMREVASR